MDESSRKSQAADNQPAARRESQQPSVSSPAQAAGDIQHQERLHSLGMLASSVAHDLNNILTSVLGHVSFLRVSLGEVGGSNPSLQSIEEGARRAAAITQQILEFSRTQRPGEQIACLDVSVQKACELFRASLPAGIELDVLAGPGPIWVGVEENQLSQVILNLLVNARDALSEGGRIRVEVGMETLRNDDEAQKFHLSQGQYASLKISDNGHGIPREVRDRIFEPFFTTKAQHGTGLGLAIVGSVVRQSGGVIRLASEPGKGTSFRILLPLARKNVAKRIPADEDEVPGGTEKILVVDDEEAVRTIIQRSLEHLGYEVCVAENGPAALASYGQSPGKFRLVIIDMIMPQMPGDELFLKLKELDADVPVLIASGYSSDSRTRRILDEGGLGFIQKPFAIEELAREVRRCLDARKA